MTYSRPNQYGGSRGRGFNRGGLVIALIFVAVTLVKYCSKSSYNEITGKTQSVGLSIDQEISLGLRSAPQMVSQHGGLHPSAEGQRFVKTVGHRLVQKSVARNSGYQYDFHLLADPNTVNAFALPGGQVFITEALFSRLENEDQLAGVLGHEIGHVIARHGGERIAKQELMEGLTGAAVMASGDYSTAQAAQMISNMVNMSYGRDQELESDELGVRFMIESGYNPMELLGVMRILEEASGGGKKQPEFMSTHPSPENRKEQIIAAVEKYRKK